MVVGDIVKIINNDNNESDERTIKQMDKLIGRMGKIIFVQDKLVDVRFYSKKYNVYRTYTFKKENVEVI